MLRVHQLTAPLQRRVADRVSYRTTLRPHACASETARSWGPMLAAAVVSWHVGVGAADARTSVLPPIDMSDPNRCLPSALDKFASTRAAFSLEAGSGDNTDLLVDIRDCDLHGLDLSSKVFSGVVMERTDLTGTKIRGTEMSRADAREAKMAGVDLTDTNCYAANFDGADLRNAQFENAILSNASFGKGPNNGAWANLEGAHFEGALVSSSDVQRLCENPTLDQDARDYELGCKAAR